MLFAKSSFYFFVFFFKSVEKIINLILNFVKNILHDYEYKSYKLLYSKVVNIKLVN